MMKQELVNIFSVLKEKSGLSNQQIHERSDLSLSTVNRFFRGEIENPDLDKVCRILNAMGYSLENLSDNEKISISRQNIDEVLLPYIDSILEPYRKQIDLLNKDLDHLKNALTYRRHVCNIAIAVAIALMVFICAILIIDLTNPNIGWYRGAYQAFSQMFYVI